MAAKRFAYAAVLIPALTVLYGCGGSAPVPTSTPSTVDLAVPHMQEVSAFYRTLSTAEPQDLNVATATLLASHPMACFDHLQAGGGGGGGRGGAYLYANGGAAQLLPNYDRKRAFYGCTDWHSAVNSTWTLITILKYYPGIPFESLARQKLDEHLGASNMAGEVAFFRGSPNFERPYGQAWLLRVYTELSTWNDPDAKRWAANIAPLAHVFSTGLVTYFNELQTPVRQGLHPNTAFDMNQLLTYTTTMHDTALRDSIVTNAKRFFLDDTNCGTGLEPEGAAFLSPCMEEADLMSHVLSQAEFIPWFDNFMPPFYSHDFVPLSRPFDAGIEALIKEVAEAPPEPAPVPGQPSGADLAPNGAQTPQQRLSSRAHLVGLAFSRAAAMEETAAAFPAGDMRAQVLKRLADIHAIRGFATIDSVGYSGTHWIQCYAMLYELARRGQSTPAPAQRAAVR